LTKARATPYAFPAFFRHPGYPVTDAVSSPILHALDRLAAGRSLTGEEAGEAFDMVMRGEASPEQIRSLLLGLRTKGESAEELVGATQALRRAMLPLTLADVDALVDTCGTGGGRTATFNISTGAAFIVAGAGVQVAKHGNRSFTSRSGSADVLEALGVRVPTPPEHVPQVLESAGIVFLFAPTFHPAMRHTGPVRKELGGTTIMNLLGPLANPAGVSRQVLGVSDAERAPLLAEALASLASRHALVVHGSEGMDEISPTGPTRVWEVRDDAVIEWEIDPAGFGIEAGRLEELAGGEPAENARIITAVLDGSRRGPARDALRLNAAAALYVAGRGWTFEEALARATAALDEGKGLETLQRLRAATAGRGKREQ
jgi:anthranilate phosphoribosyltransferase